MATSREQSSFGSESEPTLPIPQPTTLIDTRLLELLENIRKDVRHLLGQDPQNAADVTIGLQTLKAVADTLCRVAEKQKINAYTEQLEAKTEQIREERRWTVQHFTVVSVIGFHLVRLSLLCTPISFIAIKQLDNQQYWTPTSLLVVFVLVSMSSDGYLWRHMSGGDPMNSVILGALGLGLQYISLILWAPSLTNHRGTCAIH